MHIYTYVRVRTHPKEIWKQMSTSHIMSTAACNIYSCLYGYAWFWIKLEIWKDRQIDHTLQSQMRRLTDEFIGTHRMRSLI